MYVYIYIYGDFYPVMLVFFGFPKQAIAKVEASITNKTSEFATVLEE